MSDDEPPWEEGPCCTELRRELAQMAATIRKRECGLRICELDRLLAKHGVVAVYDLGRIVGAQQLSEAVDLAVRDDGWDAEVAMRARVGAAHRETGET